MRAGIGAERDAVAVDIEIAAEVAAVVEHLGGHHLAAVVLLAVVPFQRAAEPVVHADVEVEHQEDRGLQPLGEIEALRRHLEAFRRVSGNSSTCLVSPCEA